MAADIHVFPHQLRAPDLLLSKCNKERGVDRTRARRRSTIARIARCTCCWERDLDPWLVVLRARRLNRRKFNFLVAQRDAGGGIIEPELKDSKF